MPSGPLLPGICLGEYRAFFIEKTYCDDCGKENNKCVLIAEFDLCGPCLTRRIKHSNHISPIGQECDYCGGKGQIKDFYFYGHNDYNLRNCEKCNGSGRIFPKYE